MNTTAVKKTNFSFSKLSFEPKLNLKNMEKRSDERDKNLNGGFIVWSFCLSVFLCSFFVLFPLSVFGDAQLFKPVDLTEPEIVFIPLQKGDRLVIKGFFGRVRLSSTKSSSPFQGPSQLQLRVRWKKPPSFIPLLFSKWRLHTSRQDSVISIEVQPSSLKNFLKAEGLKDAGFVDLEIQGPSLPTEIYMKRAQIQVSNWSKDLRLLWMRGHVRLLNTQGSLKVFGQEGDLTVKHHKGPLELEGYQVNFHLEKIKGALNLENFSGKASLSQITGPMNIVSFKGSIQVSYSQGSLGFEHYHSPLKVESLKGVLKGTSLKGNVTATLHGHTSVSVKTKEGNVFIRAVNSGARVRLTTRRGAMMTPAYFKRVKLGGGRRRKWGSLRRSHPGKIVVQTESGHIRVR